MKRRVGGIASAILITATVASGVPSAAADPATGHDRTAGPAQSVTLSDTSGNQVVVHASRRGTTPSGRKGYVGTIEAIVPKNPGHGLHGASLVLHLDLDRDALPEAAIVTTMTGDAGVRVMDSWKKDPQAATLHGCVESSFEGYDAEKITMTYDPDCLGAGKSMRVNASLLTDDMGEVPITPAGTWSAPVATPSLPWRFCHRQFGVINPGQEAVETWYSAASKMSCGKAKKLLNKSGRIMRRKDKESVRIGRFTCKTQMVTSIRCRDRRKPSRWAFLYVLP